MMRSLFSGVSGLKSHQTRMDVIGNNIANVNTTGFKSSRTTFADTLSQTLSGASAPQDNLGGTNPKQIGLGTGVASIDLLFTDGSVQSTGKNTDLCLSGNGLFVVKQGNQTYYTRDGAFEFDSEGNYVLPSSGLYVQGWTATDGVLNTSSAVGNITIPAGKSMAAKVTTTAKYANNLNASVPTITKIVAGTTTYDETNKGTAKIDGNPVKSATITLSDGTTVTETSGSYTIGYSLPVTTTVTAYDSLGTAHSIPVYFTLTGKDTTGKNGNTWTISVNSDMSDKNSHYDSTKKAFVDGIVEADGSTTTATMAKQELKFDTDGKMKSGSGTITMTLTNGSGTDQKVTLDLSTITQYAGKSTINASADGNAAGTLSSVSVDSSGIITGTYTNGVKQTEAQVAVAQFTNASGLTKTGNSLYQESNNSGTANVKTASDLGVTITPSALEMSNVDIANEFSDMIITQRGFQSNSKIITVGDEMLETLINMKR